MPLAYNFVSLSGMGWNLFLASIPLVLAGLLFRGERRPGIVWWFAFVVFLLFLPNAAYVLTDVVQLVRRVRQQPYVPVWTIALVLVPQYVAFMLAGFQAHVLSIMRLRSYLRRLGLAYWIMPAEIGLNLAVAMGIYLGRFRRFNSWDILREPMRLGVQTAEDFSTVTPWYIVAIAFGVLVFLYYIVKFLNRAIVTAAVLPSSERDGNPLRRLFGRLSTTFH
ncbi:MAG TPA: DUF1361 domain-containing protein [Pirellulales bacterium]|jgi:uncharacterized membrane protein